MVIDRFDGEHAFLSNFYPAEVTYKGMKFPHSEGAYQCQKCADERDTAPFLTLTAGQAKRWGSAVALVSNWEEIKLQTMKEVLRAKFNQNPDLAKKLLDTEYLVLIEGNTWGDHYWGMCKGWGENQLGLLLMEVRSEIREQARSQQEEN